MGFRGGLVCHAHRFLYDSSVGWRIIKEKKRRSGIWEYNPVQDDRSDLPCRMTGVTLHRVASPEVKGRR